MTSNLKMPAEWMPQSALWLAWPINKAWWSTNYDKVSYRFAALVAILSRHVVVKLICCKRAQAEAQKKILQSSPLLSNVVFVDYETDDVWCRDFGPIFVKNGHCLEIVNWEFNAWGRKFPDWKKDNSCNMAVAELLDLNIHSPGIVLEGGAIDVNGAGTLLTTEAVLLNENRNKRLNKEGYENYFRQYLGVSETVWLKKGLYNDDTDGHIDNLARFVDENTIVIATEEDEDSPNYEPLRENLTILAERNYQIVEVPLPDQIYFKGKALPASYINFLICNDLVLVPVYGQPEKDSKALNIFKGLFVNHRVEGFDCSDFLQEGGAIHCLSQQQPAI